MTLLPAQLLGRSAIAALVPTLIFYALAIWQIHGAPCGERQPWLWIAGVAIWAALFAAGIVASRALLVRSIKAWALAGLAVLGAVIMYNLLLITALPGCSGV